MRGPMKLVDRYCGKMQCRVCGSMHNAGIKHGGGFHRGAWQCSWEQCPSNQKVWNEQRQRWVKPDWRALA